MQMTGLTCTNLPPGFCGWLEEGQKRAAPLLGNVPVDKRTAECPALATGECGRSERVKFHTFLWSVRFLLLLLYDLFI